jgi:hypothetical protein
MPAFADASSLEETSPLKFRYETHEAVTRGIWVHGISLHYAGAVLAGGGHGGLQKLRHQAFASKSTRHEEAHNRPRRLRGFRSTLRRPACGGFFEAQWSTRPLADHLDSPRYQRAYRRPRCASSRFFSPGCWPAACLRAVAARPCTNSRTGSPCPRRAARNHPNFFVYFAETLSPHKIFISYSEAQPHPNQKTSIRPALVYVLRLLRTTGDPAPQ